jgi:hypothetical protein
MVSSITDAPCWFLMNRRRNAIMSINPFNCCMLDTIVNGK